MGKILITEKQLQLLTRLVLNEQADVDDSKSDEERFGYDEGSVEAGEFKTYLDGKPYDLFMEKSDTLSKAYFESGDYEEAPSKSL